MVCPVSAAAGAFCGLCDFDPAQSICTWVPGEPFPVHIPSLSATAATPTEAPPTAAHSQLCPSSEELIYSGVANRYSFTGKQVNNVCQFTLNNSFFFYILKNFNSSVKKKNVYLKKTTTLI